MCYGQDALSDYFGKSDEAQKVIKKHADLMLKVGRRANPFYPYVCLPPSSQKAIIDQVTNKISSQFAVRHVVADGCIRGDVEDVEYVFALTYEHPEIAAPPKIKAAFEKIDTDNSGTIDRKELQEGLKLLNITATTEEVDDLFRAMHVDSSGEIDLKSLVAFSNMVVSGQRDGGENESLIQRFNEAMQKNEHPWWDPLEIFTTPEGQDGKAQVTTQNKFRIYLAKASCLQKASEGEYQPAGFQIPYFAGRWDNLRVLHTMSSQKGGTAAITAEHHLLGGNGCSSCAYGEPGRRLFATTSLLGSNSPRRLLRCTTIGPGMSTNSGTEMLSSSPCFSNRAAATIHSSGLASFVPFRVVCGAKLFQRD